MTSPWSRVSAYSWLFFLWLALICTGVVGGWWQYRQELRSRPAVDQPPIFPELPPDRWQLQAPQPTASYSAHAVWVLERHTDSLLIDQRAQEATSVASLAKLMTALVSYETYDVNEVIPIATASQALGNRAKFLFRDQFHAGDLLKALLTFSANDAAEALAAAYPQGEEAFIERMNQRAQSLGLAHTHFVNPSGLDAVLQYSSAADIGQVADTILEIPLLEEIVANSVTTVQEVRTGRKDVLYNTNSLLQRDKRFQGVKTGTTELAGQSLIVRYVDPEFQPAPIDMIIVILGSQDRYQDALRLTTWLRQNLQFHAGTSETAGN